MSDEGDEGNPEAVIVFVAVALLAVIVIAIFTLCHVVAG